MLAHYLQHVPFEGLGSIEHWLHDSGYRVSRTAFHLGWQLPNPEEIDLLVIMGGPMSVNDEKQFLWLVAEKQFVRRAVELGKPVLGICLGAQIIASALGARVFSNQAKEIGWLPIEGVVPDDGNSFHFPASTNAFHWHGETFDLPPGAIHLARSAACENQAFQVGDAVIGLQFHLETTPELAREIVFHCREELIPSRYVQTEMEILSAAPESYECINRLMADILAFLVKADGQ